MFCEDMVFPKKVDRLHREDNKDHDSSAVVVLRNQDNTLAKLSESSAAGRFLQSRTYRGLEASAGEVDSPSVLEQGRSGIARGYRDDHHGG